MIQGYRPSHLRFDVFDLDVRTCELRKNGQRIRLQDQPARLLVLLATHPGELVTRTDIQQTLWKEDEFVEFEHAINTAIRKIREALDDDPEKPKLIETLPRKGYRFIANVEEVEPAVAATIPAPVAEPEIPKAPPPADRIQPVEPVKPPEFALPFAICRPLFLFIQFGCIAIYCAALYYYENLYTGLAALGLTPVRVTVPIVVVTAMCGIAVRIYLLSAVGWAHPAAGEK